jgi:hypothetical protein
VGLVGAVRCPGTVGCLLPLAALVELNRLAPCTLQATGRAVFSLGNLEWLVLFAATDNCYNNRADGAGGRTEPQVPQGPRVSSFAVNYYSTARPTRSCDSVGLARNGGSEGPRLSQMHGVPGAGGQTHASFELWAMVGSRLFQQSSRQHSRCIKHTISSPIYRAGVR